MNAREENLERGPEAARTSIDRDYPRSPPTSPVTGKRFIVEPQVLNAALELELGGGRPLAPSLPHTAGGGLPPPPRPYSNGRKGKHPRSTPSSPATSIDHSIPSLPNSPGSSPYSNGPNTPGASSDVSPHASASAKPSPRLSNFLRGESITFNTRRRSTAEVAHDLQEGLPEEPQTAGLRQWTSRETSDGISPLDSVPSSPEMPTTPVDGARPSRHNRYLSGLQKITRLGKAKGVFAEGVRGGRRLSDAEWDPRRQDKGSGGGEGRAGARAGEGMRQPASVPSSPVAAGLVKRTCFHGQ
ncbi:hypothetical protein C2E23DRAFT_803329 [Lenzites betulinus]|nr:hypothetical protein C2E23DRAFT_803329 [Lenzites betulinus]